MSNEAVNIKIVPEDKEAIQEEEKETKLTQEEKETVEQVIGRKIYQKDDYITEDDEETISEKETSKTVENTAEQAISLLNKFKDYISSNRLDEKSKEYADKYNLDSKIVKNTFISNVLGFIGKTLHVAVHTVGNLVHAGVLFINRIIKNITKFSVYSLDKVIDFITLNCAIDC